MSQIQTPQKPGQLIVERLNKTRRQIRTVELVTTLVTLATCLLAFLLVSVLTDHWLFKNGTPLWLRYLEWLLIGGGAVAYFVLRLIPIFRFAVNPAYAAEVLESNHPGMKNRLVNWVFLRREKRDKASPNTQIERMVVDSVGHETAANLNAIPSDQLVVDCTAMIRWGVVMAVVLGAFCLYLCISPKNTFQSVARSVTPFFDIAPPQSIVIKAVEPGNVVAYQGETIQIKARLDRSTKKPVHLVYSTEDGRLIHQRLPMQGSDDGMRFECRFPPGKKGFEESVTYHVEVGDGRSESYVVTVKPSMTIDVKSVEYDYPAYTNMPKQTVESSGDLRAVEGTQATIHARSNIAMSRAILMPDGDASRAIRLNLSPSKTEAQGVLPLAFEANQSAKPVCTSYTLRCWDEEQRTNPLPSVYRVEVLKDEEPTVKWADKISDNETRQLALNEPFDVVVEARDPDFGLQQLQLRGTVMRVADKGMIREGNTLPEMNELPLEEMELLKNPPRTGTVTVKITLVPSKIGLQPGDHVRYFVEAVDTKTPAPNRATTSPRTFVVTDIDPDRPLDPPVDDQPQEQNEHGEEQGTQSQNGQGDKGEQNQDQGNGQNQGNDPSDDGTENGAPDDKQNDGTEGDQNDQSQQQNRSPDEQNRNQRPEERSNEINDQRQEVDDTHSQSGNDRNEGGNQSGDMTESGDQNGGSGTDQQQQNTGQQSDGSNDGSGQQGVGNGSQQSDEGHHDGNGGQAGHEADGRNQPSQRQGNQNQQGNQSQRPEGQQQNQAGQQNGTPKNEGTQNGRPQERTPSQPIDGESSPGDVFNEVLDHMRKNGKLDANNDHDADRKNSDDRNPTGQGNQDRGDQEQGDQGRDDNRNRNNTGAQERRNQTGLQNQAQQEDDRRPSSQQDRRSGAAPEQAPEHDETRTGNHTDAYRAQDGYDQNAEQLDPNAGKPIYDNPDNTGRDVTEANGPGQKVVDERSQGKSPHGENENSQATDSSDSENAGRSQTDDVSDNPRNQSPNNRLNQPGEQTNRPVADDQSGGDQSQTQKQSEPGEGEPSRQTTPQGGGAPRRSDGRNEMQSNGGGQFQQQGRGTIPDDFQEASPTSEAANLDYTRRATDLALRYLEDELGKKSPDQQLLDRLGGWDQNDLRRFVDRWNEMQQQAERSPGTNAERKFDEALRNIGNMAPKATVGTSRDNRQRTRTTTTESQRYAPPSGKYENLMKAYTEGINK